MSSWQPDSPVELADGTLCCKAHHLVWCGKCCVDYSFMQELRDEDEDLDSDDEEEDQDEDSTNSSTCVSASTTPHVMVGHSSRLADDQPDLILAGHRFMHWPKKIGPSPITRFIPPKDTDTPQTLFIESNRFIRRSKPDQILVYTDGACLNNGQPSPTAGCAFVFRPSSSSPSVNGTVSFRLESQGPSGVIYPQTSNRAELRAVIAALQFRAWHGEGWTELVIATDSEYVVSGATQWVKGWVRNGWMTSKNMPVKNRDLWELLLQRIQDLHLSVLFWRIPREWNQLADQKAKAAAKEVACTEFTPIYGVLV